MKALFTFIMFWWLWLGTIAAQASDYELVYRISALEYEQLLTTTTPDPIFLQDRAAIDTLWSYTLRDTFPLGHYALARVVQEDVHIAIFSSNAHQILLHEAPHELNISIVDARGKPVAAQQVQLEKRKLSYNTNTKHYSSRHLRGGLLRAVVGSDTLFYTIKTLEKKPLVWRKLQYFRGSKVGHITTTPLRWIEGSFQYLKRGIKRGDWRFYRPPFARLGYKKRLRNAFKGYIASQQPIYRHGDTLQLAAFVTDYKGRPQSRPLKLKISNRKKTWLDTLVSPTSTGHYTFQWVLGDTLPLDANYQVLLSDTRRAKEGQLSYQFKIEDYALKTYTFEISPRKAVFQAHEPVSIKVLARDANGMAAAATTITGRIRMQDVATSYSHSLYVSDTLWTFQEEISEQANLTISPPDSIWPPAISNVIWEVTFQGPNGEFKTINHQATVYRPPFSPIISVATDSLRLLVSGKTTNEPKQGTFTAYQKQRILTQENLPIGSSASINPLATHYSWELDQQEAKLSSRDLSAAVSFSYQWQNDSLSLLWENPRQLTIFWTLQHHQGSQINGRGNTNQLLERIPYKQSRRQAWLYYSYTWNGRLVNKTQVIRALNKQLNLAVSAPERVYPGQTTSISLSLTDSRGQPVKAAPLSALAYNAQFNTAPPVLASNIQYRGRRRPFKRQGYEITKASWSAKTNLHPHWYAAFQLHTSVYYRLRFPPDTGYIAYRPIQSVDSVAQASAQFAPWVIQANRAQLIHLIYLDNRLVYYKKAWQSTPYSIVTEPAYHQITLRTAQHEIRIDSVLLKAGKCADISIDLSHYDTSRIQVKSKLPYLDKQEATLISNRIFYWDKTDKQPLHMYLHQDRRQLFHLTGHHKGIVSWGLFDAHRPLTRLAPGKDTITFRFEPGFYYQLEKNRERLYQHTPLLHAKKQHYLSSGRLPKAGEEAIFLADVFQLHNTAKKTYPKFDNKQLLSEGWQGRLQLLSDIPVKAFIISRNDEIRFLLHPNGGSVPLPPGTYALSAWLYNDSIQTQSIQIRPYKLLIQKTDSKQTLLPLPTAWQQSLQDRLIRVEEPLSSKTSPKTYKGNGRLISGYIKDETGEALPFANIFIPPNINPNFIGTSADIDGYYELWVPFNLKEIQVSYVGYATVYVEIGNNSSVNVEMSSAGAQLNEVAVISVGLAESRADRAIQNINVETSNLNIRGSRANASKHYTDGLSTLTQHDEGSFLPPSVSLPVLPIDTLRERFRDYAYWQPTLVTDRLGQVHFPLTSPDDITKWQHSAVSIDKRNRIGIGAAITQSYLPLQAQLYTPRFLIEGDQSAVIGLLSNQTGQALRVQTTLQQDQEAPLSKTLELTYANSASYPLAPVPLGSDSSWITYQVQADIYQDGERRPIPVYQKGSKRHIGQFHILNDTLPIALEADPSKGAVELRLSSNALPELLDAITYLRNYPYQCNEQIASRLFALLAARRIRELSSPTDSLDIEIRRVLQKLAKHQLPTGGWGWWPKSKASAWITRHVIRALDLAASRGFKIPDISASERLLLSDLPLNSQHERLDALLFFAERKQNLDYATYLAPLDTLNRDLAAELTYQRVQQLTGLAYSLDTLDKHRQSTLSGAHYWGKPGKWWHYGYRHNFRLSLQAYQLLKTAGRTNELPAIQQYFLTHRHPQHHQIGTASIGLNTYENSLFINTLLPDILEESASQHKLQLAIKHPTNKKLIVDQFPYQDRLQASETSQLQVQKFGNGPAFVSHHQTYWETNPKAENNGFSIQTILHQNGQASEKLNRNKTVLLHTTIQIQADAAYVLVEIPVPAGCIYGTKIFQEHPIETHREYQRDRVAIFCENMPAGKYTFTTRLEARFPGTYTINPPKAEMMYAPSFNGTGNPKTIVIE